MDDSGSSSVQAMKAFGTSLEATAHNLANMSTEGYRPLRTVLGEGPAGQGVEAQVSRISGAGGVDVAREMVDMMVAERGFSANATMLRSAEETTGALLNLIA